MDTKMAATTLPLASTVKQFLKSPLGSSGKASYFGSVKPSAYSASNKDYFLNVGKGAAPSTHKTPLKARATMEAPVPGGKVRFLLVEAGTFCGGPVGTYKGKICVKERQACSIVLHKTPVKDFISGYYLQPANRTTTIYSIPFIPTSVGENNQVLLLVLDRELSKTAAMAMIQEILALDESNNQFGLEKDELSFLNDTTAQQDLVADLSLRRASFVGQDDVNQRTRQSHQLPGRGCLTFQRRGSSQLRGSQWRAHNTSVGLENH